MTLYEQLGVEQTATNEEIKRAYFRLVRQFSPEKNPDAFMRIRKAYEELSDSDARMEYDATLSDFGNIPGEAATAIMEAERLAGKGLNADAITLLERTLKVYSEGSAASCAVQYALGLIFLGIGKSGKAVTIAEKLVSYDFENTKYLRFAAMACLERGWVNKSYRYLHDLQRIDPGSEDSVLGAIGETEQHPRALGELVESIEKHGGKAPILCVYIVSLCLRLSVDPDSMPLYEQLSLFPDMNPVKQPWEDLVFAVNKLADHTTDLPGYKRDEMIDLIQIGILHGMYLSDQFCILPQIDQVIKNIGAEEMFQTTGYKVLAVGYAALKAVQAGIPKILAAHSVMKVFSQMEEFDEDDKLDYRDEVIAFELDILTNFHRLKADIKRFRDEFESLYRFSAGFLETVQRYNELKMHEEINRRISRLKHMDSRLSLDWLGEDDDFGAFGEADYAMPTKRQEPIRVTKIGRNEPCPCGSGLKYKKCCGQ